MVAAINGRETQKDGQREVPVADRSQVAKREKDGTQCHCDMTAWEGGARGFEDPINEPHQPEKDAAFDTLRISVGRSKALIFGRQRIAFDLVEEGPRTDYRKNDVSDVADIEQKGDDGDIMEELPAVAHKQRDPYPANH